MALFNYECDEIKRKIEEVSPNYPQLTTYTSEWLYFYENEYTPGTPVELEYQEVNVNPTASVSNAIPYQYKRAILKGLTLVNMATKHNGGSNEYGEVIMKPTLLKADTKYYIKAIDEEFNLKRVSFRKKDYTGIWYEATNGVAILTTPSQDEFNNYMYLAFSVIKNDETTKIDNTIRDRLKWIICEYQEGMENWNIPYFEGMQSVKMPVLTTTGKNLFSGEIERGSYHSYAITKINSDKTRCRSSIVILIPDGFKCRATISKGFQFYLRLFKDGKVVKESGFTTSYTLDNTSNTFSEITIVIKKVDNTEITDDELATIKIQIEEGSVGTEYEPYQSNVLTVNEDLTLRSNGDVYDELNLLTGRLTQRIDENNEVLAQEVVKTVNMNKLNKPYEGVNHYYLTANIPCEAVLEVPVVSTGEQTLEEINNN